MSASGLVTVGWREWVGLPELGLPAVRCKVDTGASTSALHARRVERYAEGGAPWVRFEARPFFRRGARVEVACAAPVVDEREIRSSNGADSRRVVVGVTLRLGVAADAPEWPVELTLADRGRMQFPMLLGREAMRGRVAVDPARSFLLGRVEDAAALYG